MATQITIQPVRTYATFANAVKAVEKQYGEQDHLRYFIHADETGRFFPVFIGKSALDAGVHFHFNVIG